MVAPAGVEDASEATAATNSTPPAMAAHVGRLVVESGSLMVFRDSRSVAAADEAEPIQALSLSEALLARACMTLWP